MIIRDLQDNPYKPGGWSTQYHWHEMLGKHYRTRLRMVYRFARRKGLSPTSARDVIGDCLWIGAQSTKHHTARGGQS
jgi:hypothetical protein